MGSIFIRCARWKIRLGWFALMLLAACAPPPPASDVSTVAEQVSRPVPQQEPATRLEKQAILFEKRYQPPFMSQAVVLQRGSLNLFERNGTNPERYRLQSKKDIMPRQGSLELELVRQPIPPQVKRNEADTMFVLLDRSGNTIMSAYMIWNVRAGQDQGTKDGVVVLGDVSSTIWGGWLPLPRKLREGERYTLTFSWGDKGSRVFLNNQPLEAYMSYEERESVTTTGTNFSPFLRGLHMLMIGNDTRLRDNSPLDTNQLHRITIYAEQQ